MLSAEELNALPPGEAERYNKLEALFGAAGWPLVKEWAEKNSEIAKDRALSAQNWDEYVLLRGALSVYDLLKGLEDAVELEFAQRAQQILEDASAATTEAFE